MANIYHFPKNVKFSYEDELEFYENIWWENLAAFHPKFKGDKVYFFKLTYSKPYEKLLIPEEIKFHQENNSYYFLIQGEELFRRFIEVASEYLLNDDLIIASILHPSEDFLKTLYWLARKKEIDSKSYEKLINKTPFRYFLSDKDFDHLGKKYLRNFKVKLKGEDFHIALLLDFDIQFNDHAAKIIGKKVKLSDAVRVSYSLPSSFGLYITQKGFHIGVRLPFDLLKKKGSKVVDWLAGDLYRRILENFEINQIEELKYFHIVSNLGDVRFDVGPLVRGELRLLLGDFKYKKPNTSPIELKYAGYCLYRNTQDIPLEYDHYSDNYLEKYEGICKVISTVSIKNELERLLELIYNPAYYQKGYRHVLTVNYIGFVKTLYNYKIITKEDLLELAEKQRQKLKNTADEELQRRLKVLDWVLQQEDKRNLYRFGAAFRAFFADNPILLKNVREIINNIFSLIKGAKERLSISTNAVKTILAEIGINIDLESLLAVEEKTDPESFIMSIELPSLYKMGMYDLVKLLNSYKIYTDDVIQHKLINDLTIKFISNDTKSNGEVVYRLSYDFYFFTSKKEGNETNFFGYLIFLNKLAIILSSLVKEAKNKVFDITEQKLLEYITKYIQKTGKHFLYLISVKPQKPKQFGAVTPYASYIRCVGNRDLTTEISMEARNLKYLDNLIRRRLQSYKRLQTGLQDRASFSMLPFDFELEDNKLIVKNLGNKFYDKVFALMTMDDAIMVLPYASSLEESIQKVSRLKFVRQFFDFLTTPQFDNNRLYYPGLFLKGLLSYALEGHKVFGEQGYVPCFILFGYSNTGKSLTLNSIRRFIQFLVSSEYTSKNVIFTPRKDTTLYGFFNIGKYFLNIEHRNPIPDIYKFLNESRILDHKDFNFTKAKFYNIFSKNLAILVDEYVSSKDRNSNAYTLEDVIEIFKTIVNQPDNFTENIRLRTKFGKNMEEVVEISKQTELILITSEVTPFLKSKGISGIINRIKFINMGTGLNDKDNLLDNDDDCDMKVKIGDEIISYFDFLIKFVRESEGFFVEEFDDIFSIRDTLIAMGYLGFEKLKEKLGFTEQDLWRMLLELELYIRRDKQLQKVVSFFQRMLLELAIPRRYVWLYKVWIGFWAYYKGDFSYQVVKDAIVELIASRLSVINAHWNTLIKIYNQHAPKLFLQGFFDGYKKLLRSTVDKLPNLPGILQSLFKTTDNYKEDIFLNIWEEAHLTKYFSPIFIRLDDLKTSQDSFKLPFNRLVYTVNLNDGSLKENNKEFFDDKDKAYLFIAFTEKSASPDNSGDILVYNGYDDLEFNGIWQQFLDVLDRDNRELFISILRSFGEGLYRYYKTAIGFKILGVGFKVTTLNNYLDYISKTGHRNLRRIFEYNFRERGKQFILGIRHRELHFNILESYELDYASLENLLANSIEKVLKDNGDNIKVSSNSLMIKNESAEVFYFKKKRKIVYDFMSLYEEVEN